ncbi:MAG: SpaA isopeptide-forming pilin-related protein, partial [Coriobacteriia bacterium]|nr:SpaA isopeptide-forming pilin-related protein [Coriobacteriia bacterium]
VLATLDDAYLLSFASPAEAKAAFSRLKKAGVTVEPDRAALAAQPEARNRESDAIATAYVRGKDPFTLAASAIAAAETPDIEQIEANTDTHTQDGIAHDLGMPHSMKANADTPPLSQAEFDNPGQTTDPDDISASKGNESEPKSTEATSARLSEDNYAPTDSIEAPKSESTRGVEPPASDDEGVANLAEPESGGDDTSPDETEEEAVELPQERDGNGESDPSKPQEPVTADEPINAQEPNRAISHTIAIVDSGATQDALITETIDLTGSGEQDTFGQATAVIDAIHAQSPETHVISVRVLDGGGVGTVAATYAGIKAAIARKPDIITISLSARASENSPVLATAIAEAREAGIVVVSAAGDDGADAAEYSPANVPGSITIGACNGTGTRIVTSNTGTRVQLNAQASSTAIAAATASGWLAAHSDLSDPLQDLLSQCGNGTFFANETPFNEPTSATASTQPSNADSTMSRTTRSPKIANSISEPPRQTRAATYTIRVSTDSSSYFLFDSKGTGTAFRWSGPNVSAAGKDHSNDKNVGTITYCINPHYSYDGILFGNQPAHRASAADFSDQSTYRLALAALYYGYGGPGYNSTTGKWYPPTQYDGTALTGKYRFSTTHVLLGALYMGSIDKTDVSSSYKSWFGKYVWKKGKPRANGTYAKTLLAHYNDVDMVSAGGYTIDEWERRAYIIDTGLGHQDLMTFIPLQKGAVTLVKQSERPALTNGSSRYSLKGAVYGLFQTKAKAQTHKAANAIATYKTNAKGKFTTDDILTIGDTYWIAEIEPSKGYGPDESVHKVVASSREVKVVKSTEDVRMDPVSITLGARKTLSGRVVQANEFAFQLKESNGRVLQTKRNAADGTVSFDA